MTDREKLIEMLDKTGIVWESGEHWPQADPDKVMVQALTGPRNEGYGGFCTIFTFNEAGELVSMGAWE